MTSPLSLLLALLLVCGPLHAAIDAYEFTDPEQQRRYEQLVDELRCPQCLNTNLSGSDSMIAKDLRREIHRLVTEGKSDDEVRDFMYQRYGDFILYRPRFTLSTGLLWLGPMVLLGVGLLFLWRFIAQKKAARSESLTDVDRSRLRDLLDETDNHV